MKNRSVHQSIAVKGRLCGLFALLLCFALLGTALADSAASFGVIENTDSLNLRSQGSSSSQLVGTYSRGTWVEIMGDQNNFYYVHTPDGRNGYMSKNYISNSDNMDLIQRIAIVTNANGGAFLNFRSRPNTNSQVLGIFYSGVPLLVTSEQYGWYGVLINAQYGYVDSNFVSVGNRIGSSAVATIKTPNNSAMILRNGPGYAYGVIRRFAGDSYVMVLAKGNGWWRVAIDGYVGFMSRDFLVEGLRSAKDISAGVGGGSSGSNYAVVANPRSTQALNLRGYASTGAPVIEKLYNGAKLWVDEQGSEWSAVTVQDTGIAGYVMTAYLKLHNLPQTPMRKVQHPNGTYVNLRSSPDMESNVRVRVPTGKSVAIMIPGSDWCKVRYGNSTGYILTYFLQ